MRTNKRYRNLVLALLAPAAGSTVLPGFASAYETFHGPTELIYSDPEQAAPGYLLLPSWPRHEDYEYTYLINLDGEVVHRWKTVPPGADPSVEWEASPDGVVEVDMDGNIVWEWWSLDHVPSDVYMKVMTDKDDNRIFTAHWIAPDHPGLVGRELTPMGTITDIMLED